MFHIDEIQENADWTKHGKHGKSEREIHRLASLQQSIDEKMKAPDRYSRFDESKHPRSTDGKFSDTEGEDGPGGEGVNPQEHGSPEDEFQYASLTDALNAAFRPKRSQDPDDLHPWEQKTEKQLFEGYRKKE